jgi:CelD/BcsL family acetyltransferase involved in cellulose biosynthesis
MPDLLQAALPRQHETPHPSSAIRQDSSRIELAFHHDLSAIEMMWRGFEQRADCTVFQTFDWLERWQHHIGRPAGVTPVIVIGHDSGDEPLFVLPLAVVPGIVRRLTWLGFDLCDYNAPLLRTNFSSRLPRERFREVWRTIGMKLRTNAETRHDLVELTKMPEKIGPQPNPMLALDVQLNASGAHVAELTGTWEEFYNARRSPATRATDRRKRKRLSRLGEVRMVTPRERDDIARTLEALFAQKAKWLGNRGITDCFSRPGYREFFFDLALRDESRSMAHVSRLDVGAIAAATNLGLIFRDSYYHVLASYDDGEVSRFGPGAAHLRELLSFAIDAGLRRFDFTIGDESYKLEWSDTPVMLYDHVAAVTATGWPIAALTLAQHRLKRAIKQDTRLWRIVQQMRSAFGSRTAPRQSTPD